MVAVRPLVRVVHGPLVHVAIDRAGSADVPAGGDRHPVAALPHPGFHAWDGIGPSRGWGRAGCQQLAVTDFALSMTSMVKFPINLTKIDRRGIMHVRAATFQIQSGKMQEAIDIFNNSVVPAQKAQKGYQGSYLMTDASSSKGLSISVWETEADMLAGDSSGGYYEQQIEKFGSALAGTPALEHYELSSENSP